MGPCAGGGVWAISAPLARGWRSPGSSPSGGRRRYLRRVQAGEPSDEVRVSTVELFFDLVFVFTITQLTGLLAGDPSVRGLARVVLVFGNLWWMYGGYAWLTNAVPPRGLALRLLVLVGMAGILVVALAIPDAFDGGGVALGLGYLLVTLVHTWMFLLSSQESAVQAMRRLGPANAVGALLLLAAGFAHGGPRWALWAAAFALHWGSPVFTAVAGFPIRAAHFVERHGLIVLIALGESVVAVGIGLQGRGLPAGRVATALLGLALAAALWWLYLDGEDERAERALRAAPADRPPWLALFAFGYAFLPVLGGIVVFAAGGGQLLLVASAAIGRHQRCSPQLSRSSFTIGNMRSLTDPFVVAPPSGARIRTRLRLSARDEQVLRTVGEHLGRLAGADVAVRCGIGRGQDQRACRKRALTAASSSRWAGAITRTSDDQWQRARNNLLDARAGLRRACRTIRSRLAAPVAGRHGRIRG